MHPSFRTGFEKQAALSKRAQGITTLKPMRATVMKGQSAAIGKASAAGKMVAPPAAPKLPSNVMPAAARS
jgi:hypothetical protein